MARRRGSIIGYVGATAAGAIIATLAIRAFDKHILKKGDPEEPQAVPGAPQMNHPLMATPVMPVFLPSTPYMTPMAPPLAPPPLSTPPTTHVSQEEIDIVDEIESEWDD